MNKLDLPAFGRPTSTISGKAEITRVLPTSAAKRKAHGSKGCTVFRDPAQEDRVWVLFDWDVDGFKKFVADPDVPAILHEAGHIGKPQAAMLGGQYSA